MSQCNFVHITIGTTQNGKAVLFRTHKKKVLTNKTNLNHEKYQLNLVSHKFKVLKGLENGLLKYKSIQGSSRTCAYIFISFHYTVTLIWVPW